MKESELVARLTAFGFDPTEAVAYYHLAKLGPTRAADLAKAAGLQRSVAYRVLGTLEQRGFVQRSLQRPVRFVAAPVDEVLERLVTEREQSLAGLREERVALAAAWPSAGGSELPVEERFSVHQGRTQIAGILRRLVAGARDEIVLIAPWRGLARLDGFGLLDELARRSAEGVYVRVLTEVEPANLDRVAALAKECDVRHLAMRGHREMLVADAHDAVLFVAGDPPAAESAEVVLHLRSPLFVLGQKAVLDVLWEQGVRHADRVAEVNEGRAVEQVAVLRGRWNRYNKMAQVIARAQREVLLVSTPADAARFPRAGVARELERARARGVEVRVATAEEGVRAAPGLAPFAGCALLRDGAEALLVHGADAEPTALAWDGEWTVAMVMPGRLVWLREVLLAATKAS